jgi:hypothetical protein
MWRSVWVNTESVIEQSQLDSACSSRAVPSRKHQLENPTQLSWLCACGRRPLELRGPGCCRACYYRRYHSLRFFGGLREAVLRRDRFRCRVCGSGAPLLVHHRNGLNERRLLITVCISWPRAITPLSRAQPLDTESSVRTVERAPSGSAAAAAIAFRDFRPGCR